MRIRGRETTIARREEAPVAWRVAGRQVPGTSVSDAPALLPKVVVGVGLTQALSQPFRSDSAPGSDGGKPSASPQTGSGVSAADGIGPCTTRLRPWRLAW